MNGAHTSPRKTERELFLEALERPTPSERAAFLDQACAGNPTLRAGVEALLRHHQQDDFLESPMGARPLVTEALTAAQGRLHSMAREPTDHPPRPTIKLHLAEASDDLVGQQIGRYKLLEKIGEGGCGVVYVAEQTEPMRRRVALKIIKLGMDTKQVIARFEAERQALAMMDHPNIAKVLDAGTIGETPSHTADSPVGPPVSPIGAPRSADFPVGAAAGMGKAPRAGWKTGVTGRPYFVMELVRGIRLTDYCDQEKLGARERIELFIQVCQAIQHAHQKGIIHRDLKPSNILVTLHDGVPVPKVIDFGIAKATEGRLTDATVYTQLHQFIGTPAYMSPEQAEMSGLDLDTRSDIYSLGVLLYELLTGSTPFDPQELMASGIDGMRKTIREKDPPRPSTKLTQELSRLAPSRRSTVGETKSQVGALPRRRYEQIKELVHQLKGDLDWIVMKCLEKDRTRRYPTANDLAADLRRYLNNEPVLARPPSAAYRFRKLVRRHKLVVAAAGACAAALLIGLALTTWQYLEKSAAHRRALHAEREQSRLRQEAESARRAAESEAMAARRRAYAADMNLVQQALAANNLGHAQELLNRHRPAEASALSNLKNLTSADLRGWEWRYLWQHCRSDALFTLCQLSNEVSALSVSPDGRWVAIGEYGDGISIWDLRARQELKRFPASEGSEPLAFSPTAPVLAFYAPAAAQRSGGLSRGGHIRLWDMASRRVASELPVDGACGGLVFSADGARLLVASGDAEFAIWNVAEGGRVSSVSIAELKRGDGRAPYGRGVVATPDLRLAAHALGSGRVQVVDLEAGRALWTAQAAEENVTALALSPDGKFLATGAGFVEPTIRLWEVATGRELARLEGHRTFVRALQFWPDGETLASGSGDQTIHLWDLEGLSLRAGAAGNSGPPASRPGGRLEPGGRWETPDRGADSPIGPAPRLPLSNGQRPLEPTDPRSGPQHEVRARPPFRSRPPRSRVAELHPYATLRGHRLEVWSLALCPDQTTLISGAKDGSVLVWDTTTPRREQPYLTLPVLTRAWSFAPDGSAIVALDDQGRVARWQGVDFQQGQLRLEIGTNVLAARFSSDGRFLAVALRKSGLQIWDVEQGRLTRELASEEAWEVPVALGSRAQKLLTQRVKDRSLHAYDLLTGREIRSWRPDALKGSSKIVLSPDEQWVLAVDEEGTATLRDLRTDQETALELSLKQINAAAFSPDGRWLAVVSVLGVGQLWDVRTLELRATLHGFLQGMHAVAFSPDGRRLAIGSNGSEAIKLWDVASHQELLTLKGRGSMFNAVAFSPDGSALAASNSQGLLHVWRAPSFDDIAQWEARAR